MQPVSRSVALLVAGAIGLWAQSPCGTPAANRDMTGHWQTQDLGAIATLSQSGNTITGGYRSGVPGHAGLHGTITSGVYDPSTQNVTITTHVVEGSVQVDAVWKLKLSVDGNHLDGTIAGNGSESPFHLFRTSGTVTLAPALVQLEGIEGGQVVIDTTSLAVYNCGGGPATWTSHAASSWLLADTAGASKTTAAGGSTNIKLVADPSLLKAADSPFTDTVTVASGITGEFGPTAASVQFLVSNGKDQVTLSDVSPTPGAVFETKTNVHFGAQVNYTLTSANNANLYMEVLDNTGARIAVSQTIVVPQSTHGQVSLVTDTFMIADGIPGAQMRVVMQPPSGDPVITNGGDYPVYPRAKVSVAGPGEVWTGPLTALDAFVTYTAGSPARKGITVSFVGDGGNIGALPPIDVSSGSGTYTGFLGGLTISGHSLKITATLDGDNVLDDVSAESTVQVDDPPTIKSFLLADSSKDFLSADQPLSLKEDHQDVFALVGYTGLGAAGKLTWFAKSSEGATYYANPESTNAPAGSNTIQLSGSAPRAADLTFFAELSNSVGQSVKTQVSSPAKQELLVMDSPKLSNNNVIDTFVEYIVPPSATVEIKYTRADGTPAIGGQAQACTLESGKNHGFGSCHIDVNAKDLAASSLNVTILVKHADGSIGQQSSRELSPPVTKALPANTPTPMGPVTVTPSVNVPHVTGQLVQDDMISFLFHSAGAGLPDGGVASPRAVRETGHATGAGGEVITARDRVFLKGTMNFSPPIPDDGANTTLLVYHYTSDMLPDDPGVNEPNLQLVSYDPVTQQLVGHPSTVNVTLQTVTATDGGLAPTYALAVPTLTVGVDLNLPLDPASENAPAVIALFNGGSATATTKLTARNPDGTARAANPKTAALVPGQQSASSFGTLGGDTLNRGWVQASSDAAGAIGVALLSEGTALEALPLAKGSPNLILTGIEMAAGQSTGLDFANTTSFENHVTLELHDTTGASKDQFQFDLPVKGSFSGTVEGLFTHATAPFRGYVIVHGTQRMTASALTRSGNGLAAIAGQALPQPAGAAKSLYSAHFETGPGVTARLDIANTGSKDAHVSIHANADDGRLLGSSISVTIKAGAQYWNDATTAFGLDPAKFSRGSISVTGDVSNLAGDVTFGDSTAPVAHRSSIALAAALGSSAIPYVLNTSNLPMTLYALNAGASKANVKVSVLASNGTLVGKNTLTINAGSRAVSTLSSLVADSAAQTGGAIEITSDQPLAAVAEILPTSPRSDHAVIAAVASANSSQSGAPAPQIGANGVVNGATFHAPIVRGSLGTIFGVGLGTTAAAGSLPLPLTLGGAQVKVNGVLAPLIYVSSGQINFQVPFETPTSGTVQVIVIVNGISSAAQSVAVTEYSPGVLTYLDASSTVAPVILHGASNTLVTPSDPASANEVLVMYASGAGTFDNPPQTGSASPSPAASTLVTPVVTIGDAAANVQFSGLTPGLVGVMQINIKLPATLPAGSSLPVVVKFGSAASPAVNLAVTQQKPTGNISITFSPNPVARGGDGKWTFTVTLQETGGVGVTVTKLLVGGLDFTSQVSGFFGDNHIPANTMLSSTIAATGYTPPVDVKWQITGNDDNGHTGLTWSGSVRFTN